MPRTARNVPGGMIFHVLNRGNARDEICGKDADYAAFEKVLSETQQQVFVRVLSDYLMPNHWHLVLWPVQDGDLGRFMRLIPCPGTHPKVFYATTKSIANTVGWISLQSRRDWQGVDVTESGGVAPLSHRLITVMPPA